MIKPFFAAVGLIGLFTGSYFGSTKLGLRSEGWQQVTLDLPGKPSYEAVGQNRYTTDGTRLIVTEIRRGHGGGYVVKADVRVTKRLALALFPTRMVGSYAIDRKAVERTIREAAGCAPGKFEPSGKEWVAADQARIAKFSAGSTSQTRYFREKRSKRRP